MIGPPKQPSLAAPRVRPAAPCSPPRPPRFLRPGLVERLTVLCCSSELRVQLEEERAERKALEKELEACKKQMAEAGLL